MTRGDASSRGTASAPAAPTAAFRLPARAHGVRRRVCAFAIGASMPLSASYQDDSSAATSIASGIARRPVTCSMLIR